MRMTCFVLGVVCFVLSMAWLAFGTLNMGSSGSSSTTRPATSNLRSVAAAEESSPNLDDFPVASVFAEITAIAGVGWMVAAAAFGAKAPAAPAQSGEPFAPGQPPWNPGFPPGPPTGPQGYPQQAPHHPQQPPQHGPQS